MNRNIKKIVAYYTKKYNTRDPFALADYLNIEVQEGPLGSRCGCYIYLKRHRCIFLNDALEEPEKKLVMAHELAHAIMHRTQNCYFIRNRTLLLNSKIEFEANKFAIELLVPDDMFLEYQDCTIEQISRSLGYHEKLVELKLK